MEQPAIEDISNMNDFNWEVGAPVAMILHPGWFSATYLLFLS